MSRETKKTIKFVLSLFKEKKELFFWFFVRFCVAVLPLITIYQFSHVISLIEIGSSAKVIFYYFISIVIIRLIDNFLRIRSNTKLDFLISNFSFDVHNFFLIGFDPKSKEDRHASIQAIRNFSEAVVKTLSLFKQPGIDSIVSIIFIPVALFLVDFKSFVLIIAYILIYSAINFFTSQRYKELKDFQNSKTESYYAKLQESNDIDLEESTFTRHYKRLTNWNFVEWFFLQNTAVIFYSIFLFYQIYQVTNGITHVSGLVLIMGYIAQTQTFLNSFTEIFYGFEDMFVALKHLAKNTSVSVINLEDLI